MIAVVEFALVTVEVDTQLQWILTGLVSEAEIGPAGYEISGRPVIPKPVRAEAFRAAVAEQLCIDG